jgi:hypothetical protein
MHKADPQTLDLQQMGASHPLVCRVEPVAMAIEALVAVAQRRYHWSNRRQFVEHAVQVNITRMHHQVDPAQDFEHRRW